MARHIYIVTIELDAITTEDDDEFGYDKKWEVGRQLKKLGKNIQLSQGTLQRESLTMGDGTEIGTAGPYVEGL